MSTLNVRIDENTKAALREFSSGNLSDAARRALGQHARCTTLGAACGVPAEVVGLLFYVAENAAGLGHEQRCAVMAWQAWIALAFDEARHGNLELARQTLTRCPSVVKQRAAALVSALEN